MLDLWTNFVFSFQESTQGRRAVGALRVAAKLRTLEGVFFGVRCCAKPRAAGWWLHGVLVVGVGVTFRFVRSRKKRNAGPCEPAIELVRRARSTGVSVLKCAKRSVRIRHDVARSISQPSGACGALRSLGGRRIGGRRLTRVSSGLGKSSPLILRLRRRRT